MSVDMKAKCIALLSTTASIDMNADAPTTNNLFTCPPGQKAVIDSVHIHSNSATLAGMNDVNFGGGAAGGVSIFIDAEAGIEDMTTANEYMILRNDSNNILMIDGDDATAANRTFVMYTVSGSTGAATATVDVYGRLI